MMLIRHDLQHLLILIYLFDFTYKISRLDFDESTSTRESSWFVDIYIFAGLYYLHCFDSCTRLRNFEFPRRTKAREKRSLITKTKYFTRVVTVSVVIRRIIIQTQTQKIPRHYVIFSAQRIQLFVFRNSPIQTVYVVFHETRIKNR